jgi:hypothetical protein
MAFSRRCLERHPWRAYSLTEDGEYHLQLVAAGRRVDFAPDAFVSSPMPCSFRQADTQQQRWEGGKWTLARHWSARLFVSGLRQRDANQVHAALELLIPPQSLLLAGNLLLSALASRGTGRTVRALAVVNLLGQALYVVLGLRLAGAPLAAYRGLAFVPALVLTKLWLYARLAIGIQPQNWIRTARGPAEQAAQPHGIEAEKGATP